MRRSVLLVLAWFVAGVVAVTAATAAVSRVGEQVTATRPAPLSASEVRTQLDEAAAGSTTAPPGSTVTSPTATTSSSPTTTVDPGPTATTAPPPIVPAAVVKTFQSQGGTATLRFSPSGVIVVTAVPAAGFSVDVEPEHGSGVRVEFENDDHRSRIIGWWDGEARSEVREDGDDGGSGPG